MSDLMTLLFLVTLTTYFIWLYFYKKYQLDAYRQDIFSIRDNLFMYAAQGQISFEHEAYKMARTYLNGSIRFAERLSLLRMLIMRLEFKKHGSHFETEIEKKLDGLSDDQKMVINNVLNGTVNRTILYIGDKNILIVITYYLAKYLRFLKSSVSSVKECLKLEYKNTFSDAVYNEGALKT